MESLMPLLVVSVLMLVPLLPAAILYKLLTPAKARTGRGAGAGGKFDGEFDGERFGLKGVRAKFNVVGSTATYVVLLAIAILVHQRMADADARVRIAQAELDKTRIEGELEKKRIDGEIARRAMGADQTWRIEVPVRLRDAQRRPLAALNGELQMVRVDLEPAMTQASARSIAFRIAPSDERFPTARFTIPNVGLEPVLLDLNDSTLFERDYKARRLTGVQPIWITVGQAYGAVGAAGPAVATARGAP
jgi:hypothetical protein